MSLGALSQAYRAYSEGRERGRGGIHTASTIVPYDVRDPEQMMEVIATATRLSRTFGSKPVGARSWRRWSCRRDTTLSGRGCWPAP